MQRLLIAALVATALSTSAAAAAPAAPLPDWSGVWKPDQGILFKSGIGDPDSHEARLRDTPPYTPEFAKEHDALLDSANKGLPMYEPTANCLWPGMPRLMLQPYPMEFVVKPGVVYTLHEYMSQQRRIYTDGRGHPADVDPSFNGDSVGHWEGDTLVVDTVGIKPGVTRIDRYLPHSDALHVVERIRRISPTKMEDRITIDDAKALTAPWSTVRTWTLQPDWKIMEFVCEENNRNPSDVNGVTQVIKQGAK
jgi:hypothetical protein